MKEGEQKIIGIVHDNVLSSFDHFVILVVVGGGGGFKLGINNF
jgi:hypothetical protein